MTDDLIEQQNLRVEYSERCDELLTAAQAVIDRWDTPLWKNVPATGEYIGRLRVAIAAIAKGEKNAQA